MPRSGPALLQPHQSGATTSYSRARLNGRPGAPPEHGGRHLPERPPAGEYPAYRWRGHHGWRGRNRSPSRGPRGHREPPGRASRPHPATIRSAPVCSWPGGAASGRGLGLSGAGTRPGGRRRGRARHLWPARRNLPGGRPQTGRRRVGRPGPTCLRGRPRRESTLGRR